MVLIFIGILSFYSFCIYFNLVQNHSSEARKTAADSKPIDPQVILPSPYQSELPREKKKPQAVCAPNENCNDGKPEAGKDAQISKNMKKYPALKFFFVWQKMVESSVTDALMFRDRISEFNMLFRRCMGMKMPLSADGERIVVLPNGQMANMKDLAHHSFDADFNVLVRCKAEAEKNGAKFLFVCPPAKRMMLPNEGRYAFLLDDSEKLYENFFARLSGHGIPFIELRKEFLASSLFYLSDHHWNLYGAAQAAEIVAKRLNKDYGCSYDLRYFDPACFYKERYKRLSVGSLGKKLTKAYMKHMQAEDFEVWYPTWNTFFTMIHGNEKTDGPFEILYSAKN